VRTEPDKNATSVQELGQEDNGLLSLKASAPEVFLNDTSTSTLALTRLRNSDFYPRMRAR
jgi:hypothetical protein